MVAPVRFAAHRGRQRGDAARHRAPVLRGRRVPADLHAFFLTFPHSTPAVRYGAVNHARRHSCPSSSPSRSTSFRTRPSSPSRSTSPHPHRPPPSRQSRPPRRRTDMPRMIDLNATTYWWVAAGTITDAAAVSAAVLTTPANISPYVVASTKVGPANSDTISEKSITDVANCVVPVVGNYEGTLVAFRDFTAGVPTATDVLTTVANTAGVAGWIVRRTGFVASLAAAVGQVVEVYKFMTDNPQPSAGSG